jgi:Fe-S cluster assembly protein SufD
VSVVVFEGAEGVLTEALAVQLGSRVAPEQSALTALHYALLSGGILVFAEANAEIPEPVRITRRLDGERMIAAPHTLIVTGVNSRVSVIDDYQSSEGDNVALPVVEVAPGVGSDVKYTALHCWGADTQVFSEQRTITERDSALVSLSVVTGGKVVKSHIVSSLEGRGSSSEILGLSLGSDRQHADFYTLQDHIGPDTRSDLLIKSALQDQSRAVYYGLTRVGLGAKNADANQVNRNLLLSKAAKADSDPVLEILTNDVIRVSHGATAGPVDEEQLYYLETRGIPRPKAEDLLIWGFLGQVLDRVPNEELREELSEVLQEKLGRSG